MSLILLISILFLSLYLGAFVLASLLHLTRTANKYAPNLFILAPYFLANSLILIFLSLSPGNLVNSVDSGSPNTLLYARFVDILVTSGFSIVSCLTGFFMLYVSGILKWSRNRVVEVESEGKELEVKELEAAKSDVNEVAVTATRETVHETWIAD